MEATAKHDFAATAEDELSFRKLQILKVNIFRLHSSFSRKNLKLSGSFLQFQP